MKPRLALVTLEVYTDIKLSDLKERICDPATIDCIYESVQGIKDIFQIQNVQTTNK